MVVSKSMISPINCDFKFYSQQVDRALAKADVRVYTITARGLSMEHFWVIYSHERRLLQWLSDNTMKY